MTSATLFGAKARLLDERRFDEWLALHTDDIFHFMPKHDEEFFAGHREDVLRRVEDGWRIARRTIVLDQSVLHAKGLSIFF